jgi:hypothetical protein
VEQTAGLAAVSLLPQTWKFFWAPVADLTVTRKWWYVISAVMCAAGIVAMSAIPLEKGRLPALDVAIFLASLASTFLGMAVEGLVAHATPPEQRGRVGGWMQAGNLGGSGLGGGAGLWMATHIPNTEHPIPWIAGAVLGGLFLVGSAALVFVPEPRDPVHDAAMGRPVMDRIGGAVAALLGDIWKTIVSRTGFVCVLLCVLPIGTGAATTILSESEVARVWGVSAETVATVNGVMNGLVSALGCLVGGEICARMSSRKAYALFGVLMAGVAAGMALSPHAPWSYVAFILAYAFVTGLSYAAFTGFVLDAIGKGAAATKYNAFASLANTPIAYMTLILARAFTRWDARGMLLTEAVAGVAGVAILAGAVMGANRLIGVKRPGACPSCGHDLSGLGAGAVCPECGKGAAGAVSGDRTSRG